LIKVLIGIVRKTAGGAELLGYPAGDRRGRRSVGYLPETHRIPRHHTANSALEYYGALSGLTLREIRKRRGPLLETVGLAKWGDTPVTKFSKGMQQRLGLAQAMLHNPELLILDEPTDGVDPVGRSEMRRVLRDLKDQGKTVFINSHLLQEIELVCDRVAIMNRGRVQRVGRIEELTQRAEMECGLVLRGAGTRVRQVLERQGLAWPASEPLVEESSELRMTLRLADQGAVDRLVDALRGEGISLLELTRRRDTLEEAFLGIVREQPPS
jgi:ABC-2 type transport system ATP-binding protein